MRTRIPATLALLAAMAAAPAAATAQYTKEGYIFEKKLEIPRARKMQTHELMLDPHGRFLIVTFSSYPTHLIFYSTRDWSPVKEYMLPEWFDLGSAFFDAEGRYFYVDFGRNSSKYRRIDLTTDAVDTVECYETPRGCVPKENLQYRKSLYTTDRRHFITINKKNKKDILLFRRDLPQGAVPDDEEYDPDDEGDEEYGDDY